MNIGFIFIYIIILLLCAFIEEPLQDKLNDLIDYLWGRPWKKWVKVSVLIANIIVMFIDIICALVGAFWLFDEQPFKTYGLVCLIVGVCILLVYFFLWLCVRKAKEEKGKKQMNAGETADEELEYYPLIEEKEPEPRIFYINEDDENIKA